MNSYEEKRDRLKSIWMSCMKPSSECVLDRALRRLDEREIDYMLDGAISDNVFALNQNTMGWTFLFTILRHHMVNPDPRGPTK